MKVDSKEEYHSAYMASPLIIPEAYYKAEAD